MNFKALILSAGFTLLAPCIAVAATDVPTANTTAVASSAFTDAEVKKLDIEQGKITLKHGPIVNLDMPGMTMVFQADAQTFSKLKVGDKVKFKAEKVDGAFRVTELVAKQ